MPIPVEHAAMPPRPLSLLALKSLLEWRLTNSADRRCTKLPMIQERTGGAAHVGAADRKRPCFGPFLAILPN